jgi:hypothetical protein
MPWRGTEGFVTTSWESKKGTVVWAASLPTSELVNLMKELEFESRFDLTLVLVGMCGHLILTSVRLSMLVELSVFSLEIQKPFSESMIFPDLKRNMIALSVALKEQLT